MSTGTIEVDGRIYRPESALRRGLRRLGGHVGRAGAVAVAGAVGAAYSVAKAKATPAVAHVREHAYTIIGFGLFDAAAFTHSKFAGLIVTATSFIVFEWKAQPEGKDESS